MSEISTNENKSQEKLRDDSFTQFYLDLLNEWSLSSIFMLLAFSHERLTFQLEELCICYHQDYNWPQLGRSNAINLTKI